MSDIKLNITGDDLKMLIDHLKEGGVAGAGNFRQVVENGVLTLYNNNVKIMEQAEDGTWVRTGLYTGANSIHLGGTGTTGSKSHTLTVGGQNVVFINEWSAVGGNRIAYSSVWEGISCDGETVLESSTRIYAPLSAYEPAGAPSNPNNSENIVPCVYETEAAENLVAFNLVVIAKEAYTGRIYATIESNFASSQGSELSGQYEAVMTTDNGSLNFTFENPYWLNAGDKLKISLLKEDGTPLQVLKGMGNQPWRMHNVRRFEFKPLALKDDLDTALDDALDRGNHTGTQAISTVEGLQEALDSSSSEITGAASTVATDNLSINAALISDGAGKIAVGKSVNVAHRPYKSAVMLVSQTGTSNPTAQILENTLGVTFTFTRVGVGQYDVIASSQILMSKTAMYISSYHPNIGVAIVHSSHGRMRINVNLNGSFSDGRLDRNTLEIRVYP